MTTIGTFKKSANGEFFGEIVTLSLQAKNARIVANHNQTSESAASHRVYVSQVEIGLVWPKRSPDDRNYLSVMLDDPSFNAPIYASLFDDESGERYTLVWSRSHKANGD